MKNYIWNGWKSITIIFLFLFSIAGLAIADNTPNTALKTQVEGASLDTRFQHLSCDVNFTNSQIDSIITYIPSQPSISSDKDKLLSDMNSLQAIKDDPGKQASDFSAFVSSTLRKDMNQATADIKNVKKNFRSYNLTNDTVASYKNDLTAEINTYRSCSENTQVSNGNVILKYYQTTETNWAQTIIQMGQKNVSITDVSAIDQEMKDAIQQLQTAINSNNGTAVQNAVQSISEERLHLFARFNIARINAYIIKVDPLAQQYNMSDSIDGLRQKFDNIGNLVAPGYKYAQGDMNNVWSTIKNVSKSLTDISKNIQLDRRKEMQQIRQERNQTRQVRIGNFTGNGTRPRGAGNLTRMPRYRPNAPPGQNVNTDNANTTGGQ